MRNIQFLLATVGLTAISLPGIQPVLAQSPNDTSTYIEKHRGATLGIRQPGELVVSPSATTYPQPLPPATADYPLVAFLSKGVFSPGEPIAVSFSVTNTENRPLTAYSGSPEVDYDYHVERLNQPGHPISVEWTAYGKSILGPGALYDRAVYRFSSGEGLLAPGETRTGGTVLISRLFDMSLGGTYVIHVSQKATHDGKNVILSALPVTIQVQ